MHWDAGVLAGLLIGFVWVVAGATLIVLGRHRRRVSRADGAGNMAIIGFFLLAVAALTWFASLMLAFVPTSSSSS